MPTLHNPTGHRLFCSALGRILEADERVDITDEAASGLEGGAIFIVERPEPSEKPVRRTATRGGKRVEVTGAPGVETRG